MQNSADLVNVSRRPTLVIGAHRLTGSVEANAAIQITHELSSITP
jgi:hypothetical protein